MTPLRHPGAPRLIEWTGERCVPWAGEASIAYEHFHRYLWAARLLAGRRVLDLGSGEGFGAAMLAREARAVLGIDVDPLAVEHARENYGRAGLEFDVGSALDLSALAAGSFGAVVAFEMIEHVSEHERLLDEVARVLAEDGLLIVSTPDRERYSAAAGQVNEFHERELTVAEFRALLGSRFEHVALWGQRTIAGSLLSSLDGVRGEGGLFFLDPSEGEWEPASEPEPLFCVALASRGALPASGGASTLADPTLELRGQAERAGAEAVAERDRLLAELNEQKRAEVMEIGGRLRDAEAQLLRLGDELWAMRVELDAAQHFARRVEESVTWQTFQRARASLYGLIGEDSRAGRALGAALRWVGRALGGRTGR
jgi:O-antigen biosynthesis protein